MSKPLNYATAINTELFELSVPEYYSKNIPKFFREPVPVVLPRVNGIPVPWEEYCRDHPEQPDLSKYVPEPFYNPMEMNRATTMEPVSAIVDYLDNNVDVAIFDPERAYPKIIEILDGYIRLAEPKVQYSRELEIYLGKARNALSTIEACYRNYTNRMTFRRTGKLETGMSDFDTILNRFQTGNQGDNA